MCIQRIGALYSVGMYILVYTQYSPSHCLHRDALIDTKQEAISYRSISSRGSLKSPALAS